MGPEGLLTALVVTVIAGGILATYISCRSGTLIPVLFHAKDLAAWCLTFGRAGTRRKLSEETRLTIPYAPAIAVGASVAWAMGAALP